MFRRDDIGQNARSVIEALRKDAERAEASASVTARAAIDGEGVRHTRRWTATVASQAQIDVTALLRDDDLVDLLSVRSEEFNRLIRNLSNDILDRIERQTLGAIFEGRGQADIAKSLQDIDGIGRSRARLIARDQASKLNGAMNQYRQEQAGVTHYKWRTILDGRERPSHHDNNNKIFPWSKPPATGHPGHEINCRCRGLAVLTEDPEGLPGAPDEPMGDWYTENLPLVRAVAPTPSQNILAMTPQAMAERLAQTRELAAKVSGLKSMRAFTEADAERLVAELYGFVPDDDTLRGMLTGLQKAIASRRTVLIEAAKARIELIERSLAHAGLSKAAPAYAASTVAKVAPSQPIAPPVTPSAIPVNKPVVPPAPKTLPKGPYSERLAGTPRPIDDAIDQSRKFVLREGKRTGHEWAVAHTETGVDLARMSSGKKNFVNVNSSVIPELFSPSHRVTFHHNHPNDTSFSVEDLLAFTMMPGLDVLYAHGAKRSLYRVVVRDKSRIEKAAKSAQKIAANSLSIAVFDGRMSDAAADALFSHIRMLILHRRGFVDYQFALEGPTLTRANLYAAEIERIVSDADAYALY